MPLSMKTLQRVDKGLGLVACAALQPVALLRARPRRPRAKRLLLIKFWGLGSLQLLTPAVRSLRRARPDCALTLLTLHQNRAFAAGLGVFDEVLTLDVDAGLGRILLRILALVAALRRRRFDRVYDFEFFTRFSAVVSLLSGAPESAGFAARGVWRGGFHTSNFPFNRYWHVARNFRLLVDGEDGREVTAADLDTFRTGPADEREADVALAQSGLEGPGPLVVVNANAGELAPERRWPPGSFAELSRRLAVEDRARVALVGSPSERGLAEEVARRAREAGPVRVASVAGALSLGALHALLSRAHLVVTNDSGPMHLAAAAGAPTVGLFGPETPVLYGPIGIRAISLYRPPPCSPCINVHDNKVLSCYRGRPECMLAIGVDDVLAAGRRLMRSPRSVALRVLAADDSRAAGGA